MDKGKEGDVIVYDGSEDEAESKKDKKVKKNAQSKLLKTNKGDGMKPEEEIKEASASRPADKDIGDKESPKQGSSVKPEITDGPKQDSKPSIKEGLISGSRTKKNKLTEDERYDPTPGGMEWGTPQGTDYFKSLTPGEGKEREKPLKPLNIKARKPEDEKGVKVTEGLRQQFEPEYSEAKRRLGNKIRGKLGLKKKPSLDWKKDAGIKEDLDLSHIEDKQADHSKHQYPINNEVETHDKGDKGHWLTGKDGDWYIEQDDIKELDKEAENYTFDKAVDDGLYDDDELEWEDFDNTPGFDNEINVTEALSVQGRLKRRFNARRNKQKLKVARRIALRRGSTPEEGMSQKSGDKRSTDSGAGMTAQGVASLRL